MRLSIQRLLLTAACVIAVSCAKEDYEHADPEAMTVEAIVTIKQGSGGTVFLQLNDTIRLHPVEPVAYTRQERAIGGMTIYEDRDAIGFRTIVHWLEPLDEGTTTGQPVPAAKDGLEVMDSWMTCVEDGYLTLAYKTWWGADPPHHDFYLVTGQCPDDPYRVEFRQDSHGDGRKSWSEGIVYFDLSSLLGTSGEKRTLTLEWSDPEGTTKTREFEFVSRK